MDLKFLYILFLLTITANSQNSRPFDKEVQETKQRVDSIWNPSEESIVFTGSSSIRMWHDIQERFPQHQILNTGFGGSQASDLELYLNELILDYNPKKVFIYEGDNDINAKKKPKEIIYTLDNILNILHQQIPDLKIVLISAKPSISRWHLRGKYRRLNKLMQKLVSEKENVSFVDVWNIMLQKRKLKTNLFIVDGLHMNKKGYDLWYSALKDNVNLK